MGYLPYTPSSSLEEFNKRQMTRLSSYLENVPSEWRHQNFDIYMDKLFGNNEDAKTEFLSKLKESNRILDVGCGFGHALPIVLKNAKDDVVVVGVDLDEKALYAAKQLVENEVPDCRIVQLDDNGVPDGFWRKIKGSKGRWLALYKTDAECMLKCKENTFDLMVSVQAFQYFTDKVAAFLNMMKVLKEGGTAYAQTSLDDIMVLGSVPPVQVLEEVQNYLHWRSSRNPAETISKRFKTEEIQHKVFSVDELNSFAKEYLEGFAMRGNRWIKTGVVGKKKEKIPQYCTFLIGTLPSESSYRTVSIYIENKS